MPPPGFIAAGTLGCFVVRRSSPYYLGILSNNHVIAGENATPIDMPIAQPGTLDGGELKSGLGTMRQGVKLELARSAKKHAAEVFCPLVGEEVAVGIMRMGEEGFGLKVNLTSKPRQGVKLPDEVDGVPVTVEVVGTIQKRS